MSRGVEKSLKDWRNQYSIDKKRYAVAKKMAKEGHNFQTGTYRGKKLGELGYSGMLFRESKKGYFGAKARKGWVGESTRHSMASYGIKTGRKVYLLPEEHKVKGLYPLNKYNSRFAYELTNRKGKKLKGAYQLTGADVTKGLEYEKLNDESIEEMRKRIRKQANESLQKENKGHWIVQGNYGSRWEDVTEEENKFDGLNMLRDYNNNETQYPHRLIKRRK